MTGPEQVKNVEDKENTNLSIGEQKKINAIVSNPDESKSLIDQNQNLNNAKKLISDGLTNHDPVTMNIDKKKTGEKEIKWPKIPFVESKQYTKPLLDIKNLESGNSDIPEENRESIINAINNLWEFQKIKIIGCTDASKIDTPAAIEKNKIQFNEVRSRYLAAGGICPTYEELLKSPEDPQNTVLWYARAMQWILSLNLTPDQMKKVEIGNKLWTKENFGKERGFDVEVDYTEEITRIIQWSTYENVYRMFGELNKKNIGRYRAANGQYNYAIDQLGISTSGNFEKLYQDVFIGSKSFVGENNPALEQKIKQQTTDFLNHLIDACGGTYGNGTRSSESISNKMFYLIKASDPATGFLSQQEFVDVVEKGDLSILENKSLKDWTKLIDFINQNAVVGVYKDSGWLYFYKTTDKEKMNDRNKRKLLWDDFYKMALYFELKNSAKN